MINKLLILSIMAMIIIMPLAGADNLIRTNENNTCLLVKNVSNVDFSHTVHVEYASKSTCPHCPAASSQLYYIYNSDDYDFYYVTIVTDKISELSMLAQSRLAKRLNELGVQYIPDVYFDGGYKNILGGQSDEQPYRNAIVQCGERVVPDIDLSVDVEWKGDGALKITVNVQNNELEEYNGHLRVYITEIESRWNDQQNNPYHFVVLDIPVDRGLAVVKQNLAVKQQSQPCTLGDTHTFTKWWSGDISKDNCMVIATVFDKDTDYAVQTASAAPASSGVVPVESKTNNNGYTNITVHEAWEMFNSTSDGIQTPIDIRRDDEWNAEHINTPPPENPVHYANLQEGVGLEEFMEQYADKEVVLYCRSARRSFVATELLIDNGFTGTIYNMIGGINAWKDAGYPTHKAPNKPIITGSTSGKAGTEYTYTFTATDPDNDNVYYWIEWGDGQTEKWIGPYGSDEEIEITHKWDSNGKYNVEVKAKDINDQESEWATLEVSIPKNRLLTSSLLLRFLERFPIFWEVMSQITNPFIR